MSNRSIECRRHVELEATLRLALVALESCDEGDWSTGHVIHPSYDEDAVKQAIIAIEEALAQTSGSVEQEPVAWGFQNSAITGSNRWMMLREEIPANDQYGGALWTPLYTTPPYVATPRQRTWVGLTDDDLEAAMDGMYNRWDIAEAIEAKLKAKNERKEKNTRNGGCS